MRKPHTKGPTYEPERFQNNGHAALRARGYRVLTCISVVAAARRVDLARLVLSASVPPGRRLPNSRRVLDGQVLRVSALRLRAVLRAEPVDANVQALVLVERDGTTDDAVAKHVVRHRLARLERVAGRVFEGGAASAFRSTGMVSLWFVSLHCAFTGEPFGDFTGGLAETDCAQNCITCNPGRGVVITCNLQGCNYGGRLRPTYSLVGRARFR